MQNDNSLIDETTPLEFYLSQNYPNPFKGKTTIKYCVAYKTRVQLTVYNAEGELIEKLVDEEKNPGTYENEIYSVTGNRKLESGKYIYRFQAGYYSDEKEMILKNELP